MKRFVFDLDNTLVYTNSLNNEAYNYALNLLRLEPIICCNRITRDIVFAAYPNLNNVQKSRIIELKQTYFMNNIKSTIPNKSTLKMLKDIDIEFCVLWTCADENRVKDLLEYYDISNAFRKILFSNKIDISLDIEKICQIFECNKDQLVFCEDNQRVIIELQNLGLEVIF